MNVTQVRLRLTGQEGGKVLANASLVISDCFAVHDLKVLDGKNGPYVGMPFRTMTNRCPECNCKNFIRANYCNQCGVQLRRERGLMNATVGREKITMDVAHPITPECRRQLSELILTAYELECDRPGSVPDLYDFSTGLKQETDGDRRAPARPQAE